MRFSCIRFARRSAAFAIGIALLASCARHDASSLLPAGPQTGTAVRSPAASQFTRVYAFDGEPDGSEPVARLIAVKGTLYGTTLSGGAPTSLANGGTVFSIHPASGSESVLHSFTVEGEGSGPKGNLTWLNLMLYGTTSGGTGDSTYGTVFAINPSTGKERVVYRFTTNKDGLFPVAAPIAVNGMLYGTTQYGGVGTACANRGCGTVFSVTPAGKERVVYSFKGGKDGEEPVASLVALNGVLYGTTSFGGGTACTGGSGTGCGTVFALKPSGGSYVESVLYRFKGGNDGEEPVADLISLNGFLYGTTLGGGIGHGTVVEVTTAGKERVVYRFKGGADGANPAAALRAGPGGLLYGTTKSGGIYESSHGKCTGCGTVFSVTAKGVERVLHTFQGGPEGIRPSSALILLNGLLYGTTERGGQGASCPSTGCGTIFKIDPR